MRVVLTCNRTRTRSALKQMLEQEVELKVVGTAASTRDLLDSMAETRPDLVLLDWDLAGRRKEDLLASLHAHSGTLKVVAFSGDRGARQEAMAAGADAFVSRDAPWEWLLITLRSLGGLSPCFAG
jgi:DNA-binding NarL/FixJ family response regulator